MSTPKINWSLWLPFVAGLVHSRPRPAVVYSGLPGWPRVVRNYPSERTVTSQCNKSVLRQVHQTWSWFAKVSDLWLVLLQEWHKVFVVSWHQKNIVFLYKWCTSDLNRADNIHREQSWQPLHLRINLLITLQHACALNSRSIKILIGELR